VRLRAAFGDAGLVELTAWVALQTFYSSFNTALGIEADPA
jgi:alkylhydroperoxidase family enzyme